MCDTDMKLGEVTAKLEDTEKRLEDTEKELENTKKKLEIIMERMPGGILVYEEETGKFLTVSQGCLDLFGCDEGTFREYFYNNFELLICKQDRQRVKEMLKEQMEFLDSAELNFRVRDLMGELKYVEFRAKRVQESAGEAYIYAIISDITDRMEVQKEVQRTTLELSIETKRYELLQEAVDDITFDYHIDKDELEYFLPREAKNRRFLTGFLQKKKMSEFVEEKELQTAENTWKKAMSEVVKDTLECQIYYSTRKKYVWSRIYFASFSDRADQIVRIVGSIKDISEEKREREELSKQANCDAMTGLYNKRAMQMVIKEYLKKTKSKGTHAMLMVDADNFKAINDNMGHVFGDEVIKFVARSIQSTFRESDFVGRVGGDEFLIFMKNTTLKAAKARADKLNEAMRKTFEKDDITVRISCSIGIAIYPEDGTDYETLYRSADAALYLAKERGRDRYEVSKE